MTAHRTTVEIVAMWAILLPVLFMIGYAVYELFCFPCWNDRIKRRIRRREKW